MTLPSPCAWLMRLALIVLIGPITLADVALASQGPGGGMGTASTLTQLLMAFAVYGTTGMVVAAGLIGAMRRRPRS